MKQLVARVIALCLLAVVIAIGWIPFDQNGESNEISSITDYRAAFTVAANGDLSAVETLTVSFPTYRHGIFRFFDTRDPNHPKNRLIPTDIAVTRNGSPEPFELQKKERGRYINAKIGSADVTFTGQHVYRISYKIEGVLNPGENGSRTEFYWNLIPPGWLMPIGGSRLTVELPADAENLRCAVGVGAAAGRCKVEGEGTDRLVVVTGGLAPNTPVTVLAGMDIATPDANTLPWSSNLDPILGRHPVLLGFVVVLALLLGGAGMLLSRSTHEKAPGFPLMYAPPDGVGPAQAAYILTEDVDNKAFVATMMFAAEKGVVQLQQDGSSWTVTGAQDTNAWAGVDGVTQLAGQSLGVTASGASFSASPNSVSAGKNLKEALGEFEANTKGWARTSGLMETSGLGGGGCIVLIVVFALTVFLGAFNPFNMSILAIIPGFFAIGALSVGATGAGTKRTAAGRELWSRVGGFHRILSTPSAQDRFDFSGRKDLFTQYLPWAVAFDCADEWAKKYRIETGEEPPVPSYFPVYAGVHTGNYVDQMVGSFDSTVSSAISSYEATQSSSSSGGGGGFSGGGGGGGGGGGSW